MREAPANPEYRQALAYAHHWLGETLRLWLEETPNQPDPTLRSARRNTTAPCACSRTSTKSSPQNADYAASAGPHLLQPWHSSL